MENLCFWGKLFLRLRGDFEDLKAHLEEKISFAKGELAQAKSKVFFLGPFIDFFPWSKAARVGLYLEKLTEQYGLVCELLVLYEKIEKGLWQKEYRLSYQELASFKAVCRGRKELLRSLRRGCVSYLALTGRAEELSKAIFAKLVGEAELGGYPKKTALT